MIVIRCGEAPIPPVLVEHTRYECGEVPTKQDAEQARRALAGDRRMLVCGTDAGLAALLTRFMRAEMLDVEWAYVAPEQTPATRAYGLPTGSAAARLGTEGTARELPLVRDETGTVLVGEARVTGPDGAPLVGEAYADDQHVFLGEIEALTVRPTPELPGVSVTAGRRRGLLRRTEWFTARAVQLGTDGGLLVRDGIPGRRPVKRTSFYRHAEPWRLVSP